MDNSLQQNVYPDVITRIRDLLRNQFEDDFKFYFDGSPEDGRGNVSRSILPCVAVLEINNGIESDATLTDKEEHRVQIIVYLNKRDDIGSNITDPSVDLTERRLRNIIAGRDPTTYQWLAQSFMGVLRLNYTLQGFAIGQRVQIDYSAHAHSEGVSTAQARITLTVTDRLVVPNRT